MVREKRKTIRPEYLRPVGSLMLRTDASRETENVAIHTMAVRLFRQRVRCSKNKGADKAAPFTMLRLQRKLEHVENALIVMAVLQARP